MSRPIIVFLDEVDEFFNNEVLPDAYTETGYFDNCETRVELDTECVKIRFLSYCEKTGDGDIQRVNDVLDRSEIRLEFQFRGAEVTGSWSEALTQCTIALHVPDVDVPEVLKWESQDTDSGVLKADEWYDSDREFLEQGISVENAIERALWEHLSTTVPGHRDRSACNPIQPILLKTLFNEDHEILNSLQPIKED
ncbi:hypothetical protein [Halomontanus rarus]|uniref:hypothetical protein n=1 Tax=Halomontanus rarus TaxID=3034020 RepID=UPI0023E7DF51|nr:hypothetical protein [Halovivax sp. TS33]